MDRAYENMLYSKDFIPYSFKFEQDFSLIFEKKLTFFEYLCFFINFIRLLSSELELSLDTFSVSSFLSGIYTGFII